MSLDIKFAFVCLRKFTELRGDSDYKRFCDTCKTEVINLDPLNNEARLKIFEDAAKSGVTPCVSTTTAIGNSKYCSLQQPHAERTAGIPMMPDNLKEERQRIEQPRKNGGASNKNSDRAKSLSLISKLKFW